MLQTLYISRRVLDRSPLDALMRSIDPHYPLRKSYHSTLIYSSNAVDWDHPAFACEKFGINLPLINPALDLFGPDKHTLVLRFDSPILSARHDALLRAGAVSSHPSFIPHITLSTHWFVPLPTFIRPLPDSVLLSKEVRREAVRD